MNTVKPTKRNFYKLHGLLNFKVLKNLMQNEV